MYKLKLKYADYAGTYHGFTLKPGYFYGIDMETGSYIATSGWESNGSVAIYFLENEKWEMRWIDADSDFQIENLPEISTEGKMAFVKWLEEEQGIFWNDFDNNYSEIATKQIEEEYNSYYYDGLPQFVQKYI